NLTPTDLKDTKSKYDELDNNYNRTIQAEILTEIGKEALGKIIVALNQAIQKKDKKEVQTKVQELKEFKGSKVSYRKQAVLLQENNINKLLGQAQLLIQNNNNGSHDDS